MAAGRYVVLGLAQARSPWFRAVAQWANSASIPVEFVKCVSGVELRAHLSSGRSFSAVLVDGGLSTLDRDLLEAARQAGCAVVVVDDLRVSRDWVSLGASTVLDPVFERKELLDVLGVHAAPVARGDALIAGDEPTPTAGWRAEVAMVCGPGGTGASTAAIALAQGLGGDARHGGMVLLADLALQAEQAMLHDARDIVPGVQELVEIHRTGRPPVEEVRRLTFAVEARRYDLLLGLRRPRHWASLRPRAFAAGFDALTRGWRVVVCDTGSDLEGEQQGGSADVEDRNLMARTVATAADVVFAVGSPGMKGVHALVRVVGELLDHDVAPERVVPVFNRSSRNPRARAELSSAVAALLQGPGDAVATPIHLPERRVDDALRDGVRLPAGLSDPLVGAFSAVIGRRLTRPESSEPALVVPGSLGHWAADAAAETA